MKKLFFSVALAAALLGGTVQAQGIKTPAPSPSQKVEQAVGLGTISLDYSRPSLRGREVFGELVPYDKLWRTGANASTKIKFSEDVTIEGNAVPAGEYALYTIPGKDAWTIVIHKNTKHWGDGGKDYKQEEDQARFTVKTQQNSRKVETLTINFSNLQPNSTDVEILWDKTIVPFTVKTDVDSKVMAQIQEQVINNPNATPGLYATAASYYFTNDKDLNQALAWIKKANASDPKFWLVHTQAQIEAKMKDYKNAIKTAEASLALAKKANNADYVRMNEQAIADWKKIK